MVNESFVLKNAGTSTFHEMIGSLELVESQEALDCLLDKREYMERINSSQRDITEPLTIERKEKLIKELVFDELVWKRLEQLKAVRDGLEDLGLLEWLKKFPSLTERIIITHKRESPKNVMLRCFSNTLHKITEEIQKPALTSE